MTLPLEKLQVYQISEEIADAIWDICSMWEKFTKDTVGKQLVRSADSIGANIAEGYGRYSFKENVQFCYYARGSYIETRHWLRRAQKRALLSDGQQLLLHNKLELFGPKLNSYINSIKSELKKSSHRMTNNK